MAFAFVGSNPTPCTRIFTEITANLNRDLIQAATHYTRKPAIYHQSFAGNCFERPSDACWEVGLGPDSFDCSGLVIKSICDVLDLDLSNWPNTYRHVRDIWGAAQNREHCFENAALAPGVLVITGRNYTLSGSEAYVPGHIGIATDVKPEFISYIHASAPNTVRESRIKNLGSILGGVIIARG